MFQCFFSNRWWLCKFTGFLFLCLSPYIVSAATGTVNITSQDATQTFYTQSSFLIKGTYLLTSDNSPTGGFGPEAAICRAWGVNYPGSYSPTHHSWGDWFNTFAKLHYKVDGISKTTNSYPLAHLTRDVWGNTSLNTEGTFSTWVNIAGMPSGTTHTVTVFMRDIYAGVCGAPVYNQRQIEGADFAQATLTFTIGNPKPAISMNLAKPSLSECEPETGTITVTSNDPAPNGGTVILTLPDGTSATAPFTGKTATLSFTDFGLPNGYLATGLAGQTMNFTAAVTTAAGTTNSAFASAQVLAASYTAIFVVNSTAVESGVPVSGTLNISSTATCAFTGSVTVHLGGASQILTINGPGNYAVSIPTTGLPLGNHSLTASGTVAGQPVNISPVAITVVAPPTPLVDIPQSTPGGPDTNPGSGAPAGPSGEPGAGGGCSLNSNQTTSNPIRLATGNKEHSENDFSIGSLNVGRSYHSQSNHNGYMGYGWTWSYGWALTPPVAGQITIRRAGGKLMTFNDNGTGTYVRQLERFDETVVATLWGFRYTHHNGSYADFDASGKLVSLNSEDGQSTTVAYDVNGNLGSITDPFGRSVSIAVDVNGHISTITGPTGRVWAYAYDVNNNLISVTYPDGTSRQYVYADTNDIHNLTQVIDEAGRVYKEISYDAQDRAILSSLPLSGYSDTVTYNADATVSVTESDGTVRVYTVTTVNGIPSVTSVSDSSCNCGSATDFILDPATGLLTGESDKLGISNSYTYDANGRILTSTEAVGTAVSRIMTYIYDGAGHVASMTDGLGNSTSYTYDVNGRRLTSTDPLGNTITNIWNIDGTLASVTDAAGNITSYTYDLFGQVASITNPDLSTRSMIYDGAGRIVSLTDESGASTTYTYDVRDRVLSVSYADGTGTSNTYDATGDLVSSTDSAGLITTYTYDVEHRPVSVTRPDGTTVSSTFDTKGNLTARDVLDAAGISAFRETMAYDGDGRLVSTTHADATSSSNSYDMVGRLLTATDEAGKVSTNTYDELGRLIAVTNANAEIVTYAYDAADRLIRSTAANGVTTTFAFDVAGRLVQETSSDRGFTTYNYNAAGDLIAKVDGLSVVTGYTYDANHRMTGISYAADPSRNVSFAYDVAGRLNNMTDVAGITSYTHDTMGRVTSAAWKPTGSTLTLTLAYTYDASGRLASLTYPTGRVVTYNYDTAGRIGSVDASANGSPVNLASTITYDALGNIISRTLGNGVLETRSIDSRGRVVTIDAAGVLNRSLTWSADSTITAITDGINPAASQSFVYDFADRLASAAGGYGSISYTYDANGNRTSKTDAGGTVSSSYEAATNRLASSGATTYTRDAAGNRLSDGTINYTYAVNNRLIAVADSITGAPLAGYQHNGKGERVSKTVNGITTWYLYDLSGNLIGEYDSNGVMIAEHLYGPSGRIVTIRNQQVPIAINQTKPTTLYAGLFGLLERFTFVTEAGRRLS